MQDVESLVSSYTVVKSHDKVADVMCTEETIDQLFKSVTDDTKLSGKAVDENSDNDGRQFSTSRWQLVNGM